MLPLDELEELELLDELELPEEELLDDELLEELELEDELLEVPGASGGPLPPQAATERATRARPLQRVNEYDALKVIGLTA